MKKGLEPIFDEYIEILILGSCPGDKSILNQRYYDSPNNQFWRLIGDIVGINFKDKTYTEKKELLLKNKIGLWDVMHSCEGEGSLDFNITDFIPNDFSKLNLLNLKKILFNGKTAFELRDNVNIDTDKFLLSSSSGANSILYTRKLELWKQFFDSNIKNLKNEFAEKQINVKQDINEFIQKKLIEKDLFEAKAVDVAIWLDNEGILKDSKSRPGQPLRVLLRNSKIKNAIQRNGSFWYIQRKD